MRLSIKMKISASAEKVWEVFAHQFDEGHRWMAAVPKSYSNDGGKLFDGAKSTGRIVEMNADGTGMKASERFVEYDESAKTCVVKVDLLDAPMLFPIKYNSLSFSVVHDDDNNCTVQWIYGAKIKPLAYLMWPLLRMGMFKAWKELSEEFKCYLETGEPHPRKVAAIEKAKAVVNA